MGKGDHYMKILVAYDGTLHARNALAYGIQKAKEVSGEVILLQVFDAGLFVDYEGGPRAEEMARAEAARQLEDARRLISETAAGVPVQVFSEDGNAEEEILGLAESERVDLVLAPPRYKSLMQKSRCPVYLIPGTILMPVDNTDGALAGMDRLLREAAATGSRVLLLGVVPVHLYTRWEKKELDKVLKDTAGRLRKLKKALREQGLDAVDVLRPGYPDEEILKAADEYAVSLIMLPSGGTTPSELSKAASIILDEPQRMKRPVVLLPVSETT
jgi:nucleotide-binding universal stress UspA family protein